VLHSKSHIRPSISLRSTECGWDFCRSRPTLSGCAGPHRAPDPAKNLVGDSQTSLFALALSSNHSLGHLKPYIALSSDQPPKLRQSTVHFTAVAPLTQSLVQRKLQLLSWYVPKEGAKQLRMDWIRKTVELREEGETSLIKYKFKI
jgi:hypothetical protein